MDQEKTTQWTELLEEVRALEAEEIEKMKGQKRKPGKPKKLRSPLHLLRLAYEYFDKMDRSPWMKAEAIKSGPTAGMLVEVPTQRPYLLAGLERHVWQECGLVKLEDYRNNSNGGYDAYSDVIHMIEQIMYDQKVTGAVSGFFNATLTASLCAIPSASKIEVNGGLKHEHSGSVKIDMSKLSDAALEEISKQADAGKPEPE